MQCGKAYITLLAKSVWCVQIKNVNLQIFEALVELILAVLRQCTGIQFLPVEMLVWHLLHVHLYSKSIMNVDSKTICLVSIWE